jgi:sulfur carrier protein
MPTYPPAEPRRSKPAAGERPVTEALRGHPAGKATSMTMHIQLNGEGQTIDAPATVASLLSERRPRPPFAVEVNKQLIRRPNYDTTLLSDGDHVEIVTLVGGG